MLWSAFSFAADEPARFALLIGNKRYKAEVGPLKNPHNDVALLEAALVKLKFKVTVIKDATYRDMDAGLKRHIAEVRKAGPGALSFFYYSGHGIANPETQINYLIPTDVTDANDANLWTISFEQNDIIEKLNRQAPQATHYVVFDACRNELRLSGAGLKALGAEKGFVPVAQTAGLLIAYATAPKQTASDVGDGGGPYAKALAAEIVKPDIEAVTMFRNVQLRVKQTIGQDPWLSFPSLPEVYLAGRKSVVPTGPITSDRNGHHCVEIEGGALVCGPEPTQQEVGEAAQAWDRIKDTTSTATLQAFVKRFGDTFYGDLAKQRLSELNAAQVVAATSPLPKKPAEAATVIVPEKSDLAAPRAPVAGLVPGSAQSARDALADGVPCPFCPEMVVVPAGRFTMGSAEYDAEKPPHNVDIARPFAVGKFEVMFAEWDACVDQGACKRKPDDKGWGRGKQPVIDVSWDDITREYLPWLSRKTGKSYRLLSEAEWEYAARAGTKTNYFWGDEFSKARANNDKGRPLPVGQYAPNAWGLHDMHGNVLEWTEDCWNSKHDLQFANGNARTTGDCRNRVLRGGSWKSGTPLFLRSAFRDWLVSQKKASSQSGFRVARMLAP